MGKLKVKVNVFILHIFTEKLAKLHAVKKACSFSENSNHFGVFQSLNN